MTKIKAIIFDFDGVIIDTFGKCFEIYNEIGKIYDKRIFETEEELRMRIEKVWNDLFERDGYVEDLPRLIKAFKARWNLEDSKLFEGIKQVLNYLRRNYRLAIISSTILMAIKIIKGGFSRKGQTFQAEEARIIQEIYQGLSQMEKRLEALETIVLGHERKERGLWNDLDRSLEVGCIAPATV